MKPTPPGWPRIATALYYDDARAAIDWLMNAFGFELKMLVEGDAGEVVHSELTFGGGLIMVGATSKRPGHMEYAAPPAAVAGKNTQNMMVYVDDVEAHVARARAAGATITKEPEVSDYGPDYWTDRGYECRDLGGHHWWFYQRLRTSGQSSS